MNVLPAWIWLQAQPASPGIGNMLIPMAAIFLIFYFLLIRPQNKRQKEQEEMIKAVAKGDDVVTTGGIHGKVTGATDDVLTLEIASLKGERVRIKVDRGKVERVAKADAAEAES